MSVGYALLVTSLHLYHHFELSTVSVSNSFDTMQSIGDPNDNVAGPALLACSTPTRSKTAKPQSRTNNGNIKFISVNVNGIRSKQLQIQELLHNMDSVIILCQETKINSIVLLTKLFPQSYMVFCKDCCLQAGVVLIAIQKKFQATECHELDVVGFEAIWVKLYTSKCCYDHRTFIATVVVGYHRTNTATAVFYSVPQWSFWVLFPENSPSILQSSVQR